MILPLLLLPLPFALWWAVLWLAIPVDWDALTLPKLILLHVVPPLAAILSWLLGKRLFAWRTARRKRLAAEMKEAEQQQARETARAAHRQALEARRASVECRAVLASLTTFPTWAGELPDFCALLGQDPDTMRSVGYEEAISKSLRKVFEAAFASNEALAWLPVYVVTEETLPEAVQPAHVTLIWQQAIEVCWSIVNLYPGRPRPSSLDCQRLPGEGDIVSRALALFEHDPSLPAFLLVGQDSPLAEMSDEDSPSKPKPGHAVLALLFARPGLVAAAPEPEPPAKKKVAPDLVPYWERPAVRVDTPGTWGRVPVDLQAGFMEKLPPLAALTRPRQAAMSERPSVSMGNIKQAIDEAFIDAALRGPPIDENGDSQKKADADQDEQDGQLAPEIGWMVHGGDPIRFPLVTEALCGCRSDLSPISQGTSVLEEQGDVGAAHDALMQALAVTRAGQLKLPVLLAETLGKDKTGIAFVRPCG